MNAVPRRHPTDDDFANALAAAFSGEEYRNTGDLKTIPHGDDGSLWVECECVQPKSMVGRTAYIYFDRDDVLKMLKECRSAAIAARSQPMGSEMAATSTDE